MNYLAHARLSFNKTSILLGNMISDYVKGKARLITHLPDVQKGIVLHREIDTFTDAHPTTKEMKEIFRPAYRLYGGAFADVVYDHFLAIDKEEFPAGSLSTFAINVYNTLEQNREHFPEKFATLFPYMKTQNWLDNYQHRWGIQKSMQGVVRRSQYLTESDTAFSLFENNYTHFEHLYKNFWPDIKHFASNKLGELENN